MKRRRVLSILAGAAALPLVGGSARANLQTWKGIALGAEAQIVLDHPDAERLLGRAVEEIGRLEGIFSLYRTDSELSRLNRDAELSGPSFEMIELLSLCSGLHARTDGAFNPAVQPLWALYAQSFANGTTPGENEIARARALSSWSNVLLSSDSVSFGQKGMMLTLNGVAQGFIADRISAFFSRNGVENVLVNTGEIMGNGHGPDGTPWQVGFPADGGSPARLNNMAIATSAPLGTAFDQAGTIGHIIDPRTGRPGGKWSQISVIARSAALADGLSTGFALMGRDAIERARGEAQVFLS